MTLPKTDIDTINANFEIVFARLRELRAMTDSPANNITLGDLKKSIEEHQARTMKESFDALHSRFDTIEDGINDIYIPPAPPPEIVYEKTSEGRLSAFIAGLFVGAVVILGFNQFYGISTVQQVVDKLIEVVGALL